MSRSSRLRVGDGSLTVRERYGQRLHIPFVVVQWDTGTTGKYVVVVLSSLLVTLGLVELIKRTRVLRGLFGIMTRSRKAPSAGVDLSG